MTTCILWFRRDLRLHDNPALRAALEDGGRLLPVYIHAPHEEAPWAPGAASRWWLHHSLQALREDLRRLGSDLLILQGDSLPCLRKLIGAHKAHAMHWNRLYDPATVARDKLVKQALQDQGVHCASHAGALLQEPWQRLTGKGTPYRVFTPFWKASLAAGEPAPPLPAPDSLPRLPKGVKTVQPESLELLPRIPWDEGMREAWRPGEAGAEERIRLFEDGVGDYEGLRDLPAEPGTSRLSPHLHFGEVSPRQLYWAARNAGSGSGSDWQPWVRQLYWREFAHHLLYHFPHTQDSPLDKRFEHFPWEQNSAALAAWQRGETGIPMVDAGMRELWHTGWMHNRVRMLVASLLTKNLRIHWREGARWFWDTLVDADLPNNSLGWQWTAGCGADAAPYFRIFNPVLQGQRFDKHGAYLRRWLPELSPLPDKWLHAPWQAPAKILDAAGLRLGRDYPSPIVDLAASRQQALDCWVKIKALSPAN